MRTVPNHAEDKMNLNSFDTLEYLTDLKKSGVQQEQAEGITKATAKALAQALELKEIVTKSDFKQLEAVLKKEMSDNKLELVKYLTDTKIELMKFSQDMTWKMVGILIGFQTLLLGAFSILQYFFKAKVG